MIASGKGISLLLFILLLNGNQLYAQHKKLLCVKKTADRNFSYRTSSKIEKICRKKGNNQTLTVWLADIYLQRGDYHRALPILEEVAAYKNISNNYCYKLAQTYLFFNRQEDAVKQLQNCGKPGKDQMDILSGNTYIQPLTASVVPLSFINTPEDEISTGLYSGKIIYSYVKKRRIRFLENNDIYFSTLMDRGALADKIYPYNNNRRLKDDYSVSASAFDELLLSRRNKRKFFRVEKPKNGLFFKDEKIGKLKAFNFNNPSYNILHPFLADGGSTLYFSSDMKGGKGGYDLYVCYKHPNGWSYPQNLGESINTFGDEKYPCFVDSTLYFSSDGLPGFGNMDVFFSKKTGSGFSAPQNMGLPVNSPNNDMGFYLDKNKKNAVLSSDRSQGKGGKDLYIIRFE